MSEAADAEAVSEFVAAAAVAVFTALVTVSRASVVPVAADPEAVSGVFAVAAALVAWFVNASVAAACELLVSGSVPFWRAISTPRTSFATSLGKW